jgi:hypothetical protein
VTKNHHNQRYEFEIDFKTVRVCGVKGCGAMHLQSALQND